MTNKETKKSGGNDGKKEKKKPQQPDRGKFISRRDDDALNRYQKYKTVFLLLSTLFFAISLFLPVDGRERLLDVLWASTLYTMFDIVLIATSVYVAYQGFRRQKIRKEVPFADSPHYGYKPFTFVTFELFNLMHLLYIAAEIAMVFLVAEVWGIINIVVAAISFGFSMTARQFLYRANAKQMDFLPPIQPNIVPDEIVGEEITEKSEYKDSEKFVAEQTETDGSDDTDADI